MSELSVTVQKLMARFSGGDLDSLGLTLCVFLYVCTHSWHRSNVHTLNKKGSMGMSLRGNCRRGFSLGGR